MVNIDGNGNRVACLIHGPEHVIVVAGMNKVVEDVDSGIERVGIHAAPPNAARLGTRTPCAALGHCGDCHSEDCMCCQIVITRHSRHKGRIKVILIGEELGFIGCCLVVFLLLLIIIQCIIIGMRAQSLAGQIICGGVAALIGFQSFINMGVATGVLPNTGLSLPFVSAGLTSIVCFYMGIGFVLNVGLQPKKY